MKNRKRNGKVTPAELLKQINMLQKELFAADVQYDLQVGLRKAVSDYEKAFRLSPLFWNYTLDAHFGMVVLRLCRIYDADENTMSLPRFLKTLELNGDLFNESAFRERNHDSPNLERLAAYPRSLDLKQLAEDKKHCSPTNSNVKHLFIWRNNILAHLNYKAAIDNPVQFNKRYPLYFRDINILINDGFLIVNKYAETFGAAVFPRSNSTNYPVNDYQIILDLCRTHVQANWGG